MAVQVEVVGPQKFLVRIYQGAAQVSALLTEYIIDGQSGVVVTAAEPLGAYRAITSAGQYVQPTSDSMNQYAGITLVAVALGEETPLIKNGPVSDAGWTWTPNAPVFVTANGVLTQTASSTPIRRIGWAISATQINLDPFPTIGV